MDNNPYAPPRSNVELTASSPQTTLTASRLYSSKQIAVATFLGSPLAGGWFMATNYRELRQDALATQTIWWGVAGAFAFHSVAESKFGGTIKEHQAAGGPLFSWWRVVGVSLLCALILVAVIFGVLFILAMLGLIDA